MGRRRRYNNKKVVRGKMRKRARRGAFYNKLGIPQSVYTIPHFFKRKCRLDTITTDVAGYASWGKHFQLSDLPSYSELCTTYDEYSIRYVKLYVVCRPTNVGALESAVTSNYGMPNLIAVRDYNDATAPPSDESGYNELREYGKSKTFTFTAEKRCFMLGLVPALQGTAYSTSLVSCYNPLFKKYIPTSSYSAQHFGVKMVVEVPSSSISATPIFKFDVYATYYLACKDTK